MARYDFHTADNAEPPHVSVYDSDNDDKIVAMIFIRPITTSVAESMAEMMVLSLNTIAQYGTSIPPVNKE